jgi:hypothetical protein
MYFLTLDQPGNSKRGVVAVAAFDEIEVTDLENMQSQWPVRKYALLQGKQRNRIFIGHEYEIFFIKLPNLFYFQTVVISFKLTDFNPNYAPMVANLCA